MGGGGGATSSARTKRIGGGWGGRAMSPATHASAANSARRAASDCWASGPGIVAAGFRGLETGVGGRSKRGVGGRS